MPGTPTARTPVLLIIRDGWGENPDRSHDRHNAVRQARTPVDEGLRRDWPSMLIRTSGENVGLPAGVMGNSEVGHQNIGAGRVVDQEVMRITRAVREGAFFDNQALRGAFDHATETGGSVHLLGLVSDGKVHSDLEHLFALIDLAQRCDFPGDRVFIHAITDGRDVGPTTGVRFVQQAQRKLDEAGRGRIASVIGRYYAMDRDHRWERIARAYACLTDRRVSHPQLADNETAPRTGDDAVDALRWYYDHPDEPSRRGDEFMPPTRITRGDEADPVAVIRDGDAVIFFNFRGDRPRQLTRAFVLSDEDWRGVTNGGFDRGRRLDNLYFGTMTGYEQGLPVSAVAFHKPPKMADILGQVVSDAGLTQFRCAETEKFPHVTFFFNDYREAPFEGERRELIPSPQDVTTYDQKPQMSAPQVCDAVVRRLQADDCEALLIVNFANPDMVGHTGNLPATIQAVQTVDECVGRIVEATLARGGALIITADHGNAELMWDDANDCPHTAHTTFDVPLIVVGEAFRGQRLSSQGRLADIAPTLLTMMGLDQPTAMTGQSLFTDNAAPV